MAAVEGLSKLIAWMIVTFIKIMVYPVYIISNTLSIVSKAILDSISSKNNEIEIIEE